MASHADLDLVQRIWNVDVEGKSLPVTLLVDGVIVSGEIIPQDQYHRRYAEMAEDIGILAVKTIDWDEQRQKTRRFAQRRLEQIEEYFDSLEEFQPDDPEKLDALAPNIICLDNVRIQIGRDRITFGMPPDSGTTRMFPTRLKLASVAGWHWGLVGPAEVR